MVLIRRVRAPLEGLSILKKALYFTYRRSSITSHDRTSWELPFAIGKSSKTFTAKTLYTAEDEQAQHGPMHAMEADLLFVQLICG